MHLGEDIAKIHNRMIEVIRGKLNVWQISPITTIEDFQYVLQSWETYFRRGDRGRYARYSNGLTGLESIIDSYSRGLGLSKLPHFNRSDLDEVSEWLEANLPITVSEELATQAVEANNNNNLRLAIFNYVIALEQTLQQYLAKQFRAKLDTDVDAKEIDYFLRSDQTNAKDKLNILLRLVIHESWLRGIDFQKIETAIEARNKIAHGETINVIDRYSDIDWKLTFRNIESLIKSLTDATRLIDKGPEIKALAEAFHQNYNSYPSIWIYKKHQVTCEIILYFDDMHTEEMLVEMVDTLITKRSEQDDRFNASQHLAVTFIEFPDKKFATWKAERLRILGENS